MSLGSESAFEEVFADLPAADTELVVANRTAPSQVTDILERAFSGQSVSVAEQSVGDRPDDDVLLRRDERSLPELVVRGVHAARGP